MKKNERRIISFNADPDVIREIELKTTQGGKSDLINKILRKGLDLVEVEKMDAANSKRYQNIKEVMNFVSECKFIDASHLANKMSLNLGVTKKKVEEYIELLIEEKMLFRSVKYILDKDYYAECIAKNKSLPGTDEWIREIVNNEKSDKKEDKPLEKKETEKIDAFLNL